mgnify:CR=1 FL=1
MSNLQISNAVTNYDKHNRQYYLDFLWGKKPIKNRPSAQDIISIMSAFHKSFGSTMYAPYAERIAIVELNP